MISEVKSRAKRYINRVLYGDWADTPCEHAGPPFKQFTFHVNVNLKDMVGNNHPGEKIAYPDSYESVSSIEHSVRTERKLTDDNKITQEVVYQKCPLFRCKECGELIRGPWVTGASDTNWKN